MARDHGGRRAARSTRAAAWAPAEPQHQTGRLSEERSYVRRTSASAGCMHLRGTGDLVTGACPLNYWCRRPLICPAVLPRSRPAAPRRD